MCPPRHLRFIEDARRYALDFRSFTEEGEPAPTATTSSGWPRACRNYPCPSRRFPAFARLSTGAVLADTSIDLAFWPFRGAGLHGGQRRLPALGDHLRQGARVPTGRPPSTGAGKTP